MIDVIDNRRTAFRSAVYFNHIEPVGTVPFVDATPSVARAFEKFALMAIYTSQTPRVRRNAGGSRCRSGVRT